LMEEREFEELVEGQLQRLSHVERAVLVLYHQEERTYEQIALALGLPIGTVRTHLHRGRKKLREGIAARRSEGDRTPVKEARCTSMG
jgi:RNA polymerase sigma factor (sigma-70 family)